MILTAKHHDGFCLWPSRTTTHCVARVRGATARATSCASSSTRAAPRDCGRPVPVAVGPQQPGVRRLAALQRSLLRSAHELLTHYGPIHEVWFDGANGEGPNGKKQEYDWPRVWGVVRRLQPKAVMFSDAGPDVRWCGNESGDGRRSELVHGESRHRPRARRAAPGRHGLAAARRSDGTVWRPAECDVSIRPGWFHHPAEDARVRTVDALVNLYFRRSAATRSCCSTCRRRRTACCIRRTSSG